MADRLLIQDLAVESRIGVFDWEQASPQTIWIDLELAVDAAKAAARDDVSDAVDYGRLVTTVRELARQQPYRLLETLAEAIAQRVLGDFDTTQVLVRIKKRALPGVGHAAVEVQRRAGRRRVPPARGRAAAARR